MMFHNTIPITALGQQWMDDGIDYPPDQWYWHWPSGTRTDAMPDDLDRRWELLLIWIHLESYWDQCIRQAQVSGKEYQWVIDYLTKMSIELNLLVPARLSGLGFEIPLEYCRWGWSHFGWSWSHYPEPVIKAFERAGIKLNPTNPLDDERHPLYNEYSSLREHIAEQEQLMKPRPKIERDSGSELPSTVIMED